MMKTRRIGLRFVFVVLVVGVIAGGCLSAGPKPATRVAVLTYNIYHGEDANGGSNLDAIAGTINLFKPDLVALQEVDNKTTRVKGLDLTAELSKRTGMQGIFGKAMDYAGGEYGEAVLCRHRVLEVKDNPLPHTANAEPRAALEVHVELPSGEQIVFVGTHLDHVRDQTNRMMQARRIMELFGNYDLPMILAGDLNAVPGSEPINLLCGQWTCSDQNEPPRPTHPSGEPRKKIDYIMFKPDNRWKVVTTGVIDNKVASDHCAVYAVLELLPAKKTDSE
jgi:endonuclease/exonuclease/phosphatase family metal-dependent hydrolase